MKNRLLFLTTANLSTNPRCYKEIELAINLGYQPIVVAFYLGGWSITIEKNLAANLDGVDLYYIDATKGNKWNWLLISMLQKILSYLPRITQKNSLLQSFAIDKRSFQLTRFLKKNKIQAQMVIAHNLGAFYPAYYFSKQNKVLLGIDIEDDHAGEANNIRIKGAVNSLMSKILPEANYLSFAAPLIKQKIQSRIAMPLACITQIINNVSCTSEFIEVKQSPSFDQLKLVWFSQNIDYGRGLEKILPVLDFFAAEIELTLIGNLRDRFNQLEVLNRPYIKTIEALPQVELHQKLSDFDIGLAIEDAAADENRTICLTNKIWGYFQAGLYILATDTPAQQHFIEEFQEHGCISSLNEEALKKAIQEIINQMAVIKQNRSYRFNAAKFFSWEQESVKLKNTWQLIFDYTIPVNS